jgi:hypothetical protein
MNAYVGGREDDAIPVHWKQLTVRKIKKKTPGRKRIYKEEICNVALNGAVIPEKRSRNGSLNPQPCRFRLLTSNDACLITSLSVFPRVTALGW